MTPTPQGALEPELVPEPLWWLSARNLLQPRSRWEAIRREVVEESGSRCTVCEEMIERGAICHEQWSYEEEAGVARLGGLALICRPCNGVHHSGQASGDGWRGAVLDQLAKVNGVSQAGANAMLGAAMLEWRRRSRRGWTITVDPALLKRFPDLHVLEGLSGNPGDGRRRRQESRLRRSSASAGSLTGRDKTAGQPASGYGYAVAKGSTSPTIDKVRELIRNRLKEIEEERRRLERALSDLGRRRRRS